MESDILKAQSLPPKLWSNVGQPTSTALVLSTSPWQRGYICWSAALERHYHPEGSDSAIKRSVGPLISSAAGKTICWHLWIVSFYPHKINIPYFQTHRDLSFLCARGMKEAKRQFHCYYNLKILFIFTYLHDIEESPLAWKAALYVWGV